MTNTEFLALAVATISLVVSVASAALSYRSARHEQHVTTYQGATSLVLEIDRLFIQYPHLRPLYYGGAEKVAPGVIRENEDLLDAISEFGLDALECIWDQRSTFTRTDRDSWADYIKTMITAPGSPLRSYYVARSSGEESWYPTIDELMVEFADGDELEALGLPRLVALKTAGSES